MFCKVRGNGSPEGKRRVYFACHPEDFQLYFEPLFKDITDAQDCAVYYPEDLTQPIQPEDLAQCNLLVVPVSLRLLTEPNSAMDVDVPQAKQQDIPVLPILMERNLLHYYGKPEKFGDLQYLSPLDKDDTRLPYKDKLKKYLSALLISDQQARRVRDAFDAYIFLSYRKMDRHHANELMRLIHSRPAYRDIAIWYDEYLTPGESFRENIHKYLEHSQLFALLVTPNILEYHDEKKNFVMGDEYPAAHLAGLPILPVEMEPTDKATLQKEFLDLPPCVDPQDQEAFTQLLLDTLSRIARKETDDPAHNYLIGLAYLEGIDVEVDRDRGLALIRDAAQDGLPEAMEQLYEICHTGVYRDFPQPDAIQWAQKLVTYYETHSGPAHTDTLWWRNTLAQEYAEQNHPEKALPLYRSLHDATRRLFGIEDPRTLTVVDNLAQCLLQLKQPEEAARLLETAYGISCRVCGEGAPVTFEIMNALAGAYADQGLFQKALPLTANAYHISRHQLGEVHFSTLTFLRNLINLHVRLEEWDNALELLQEGLRICREELPAALPEAQYFKLDLAELYCALEQPEEARLLLDEVEKSCGALALSSQHHLVQQTWESRRIYYETIDDTMAACSVAEDAFLFYYDNYGPTHLLTLRAQLQCAASQIAAGRFQEGQLPLERAVRLLRTHYGNAHEDTIRGILQLAMDQSRRGASQEAFRLAEEAYQLCKKHLPPRNDTAINAAVYYSIVLRQNGQYEKAFNLLKVYGNYCEQMFSQVHSKTQQVCFHAAAILKEQGALPEALDAFEEIYQIRKSHLGENHTDTLTTLFSLGSTHLELDHRKKSLDLMKEAHEKYARKYGENALETLHVKSALGFTYGAYGNAARELRFQLEVHEQLQKRLPETNSLLQLVTYNLAVAYLHTGDTDQAIRVILRLRDIQQATLPPDHPDVLRTKQLIAQIPPDSRPPET